VLTINKFISDYIIKTNNIKGFYLRFLSAERKCGFNSSLMFKSLLTFNSLLTPIFQLWSKAQLCDPVQLT
jgi:hypothetical protein